MLIKQVNNTKDILNLRKGDFISKSAFSNIIISSREPKYLNNSGKEYEIKNSHMKGINWVGDDEHPKAVFIKSSGKYSEDDYNEYAFEARNGIVNKFIKSNQVLINQPIYHYPIYYFVEYRGYWKLLGRFQVDEIRRTSVIISPYKKEVSQEVQQTADKQLIQSNEEQVVQPKKEIIETLKANRSASPFNGKCKFIKEDGSYILADEKGMENSALSWSGQYIKLNIFKIEDGIITDWNWEKID